MTFPYPRLDSALPFAVRRSRSTDSHPTPHDTGLEAAADPQRNMQEEGDARLAWER